MQKKENNLTTGKNGNDDDEMSIPGLAYRLDGESMVVRFLYKTVYTAY